MNRARAKDLAPIIVGLAIIAGFSFSAMMVDPNNCTAEYDAGRARGISTTLAMMEAVSINSRDLRQIEEELR